MSSFVAIAHAQLPAPELSTGARWLAAASAAAVLVALGLSGETRLELLVASCGCLAGSVAWWWFRERSVWTFGSREDQRRAARAILLSRLDRERRSVGLDQFLLPEQVVALESAAQIWERIENTLTGPAWKAQASLKLKIERASFETMVDLISYSLGDATAQGLSAAEVPDLARHAAERLQELGRALGNATAALESYYRPDEQVAAAPPGAAFDEVEALERLL